MDYKDFRILGLAGSLRRASVHRGILRAAHEVAPEWMICESFDLARIPYFNQDLEDEGNPEPVRELREKIRAYDAVLIATPEYHYAIPGVLTAAFTLRSDAVPSQAGRDRGGEPGRRWDCPRSDGLETDSLARAGLRDTRSSDAIPFSRQIVARATNSTR